MTITADTARHASLEDLAEVLRAQRARQLDVVAPAAKIRARGGQLVLTGTDAVLDDDGVTPTDGVYRPTAVFDEGVADRLGIPVAYLRKLREQAPDLYDANVNGLLHGRHVHRGGQVEVVRPGDDRSFFLRLFRGEGSEGVARAMMSDRFRTIDNLDILVAALDGVRNAGVRTEIHSCDLTERRMFIRLHSPELAAAAPTLLANYRSPFLAPEIAAQRRHHWDATDGFGYGYAAGEEPVLFAGLRISNSEVGNGAFKIVPELLVKICANGMTINVDAMKEVHVGGKLDEGVIAWSGQTQSRQLELIGSKTTDAVRAFLSEDYLRGAVATIEADAGKPVTDAQKTIEVIGKQVGFTKAETAGVLDHFIRGAQMTAGGIANAITSFSQTVLDADRADAMDGQAVRALQLV